MAADGNDYRIGTPQVLVPGGQFDMGLQSSYPYTPPVARAFYVPAGGGACDPQMRDVSQRLLPYRYATAALRFTIAGAGSDLVLAAGDKVLFSKGFDDTDASSGFAGVLTQLDTNAPQNGALVQNGQMFYTVGIGCSVGEPYVVATGATASDARDYPAWLDSYRNRVIRAALDVSWGELKHGQNPCKYGLGPLAMWGTHAGVGSKDLGDAIAGQFWYLSTPDASTSSTDGNQGATLTIHIQRQATVGNDAAIATPAALDVILPVRAVLYGVPVCTALGATVGDTTMRDQVRQAIVGAAADLGVTPQALINAMNARQMGSGNGNGGGNGGGSSAGWMPGR